jgi:hypothetical protein
MTDHFTDAKKMVSDTPRTDKAIWNNRDTSWMDGTLCRQLERELNEANKIIRQQQLMDERMLAMEEHIKRLEKAGDILANTLHAGANVNPGQDFYEFWADAYDVELIWIATKEIKL